MVKCWKRKIEFSLMVKHRPWSLTNQKIFLSWLFRMSLIPTHMLWNLCNVILLSFSAEFDHLITNTSKWIEWQWLKVYIYIQGKSSFTLGTVGEHSILCTPAKKIKIQNDVWFRVRTMHIHHPTPSQLPGDVVRGTPRPRPPCMASDAALTSSSFFSAASLPLSIWHSYRF